ncbi:histidine ammonia-lyase [Hazenella sp. IB182357]|uniref:Histidine ammonia-lyase n=1 Tax=Polycladospora coralii TaxID=2771432 RepID=A0A926NCC5_9BACL|nr:histidine ammonia-lyase [Polycladospora coralii]MBD1373210.1 histidine ammonia-lyase [Polycladospora coralii]
MGNHYTIEITGNQLTYEQFQSVVYDYRKVQISESAYKKINESRKYVEKLVQEEKTVYGITTGFGKFSDIVIQSEQTAELQSNLIISHACGVGEPLAEETVRGMMLLRINALAKGYSGIKANTLNTLVTLLNHGVHPIIPAQGSLGASGDLAPLAHMCLPLLGLGEVFYQGMRQPTNQILKTLAIPTVTLDAKEGLALINGTQMMTSLGIQSVLSARNLLFTADILAAMTVEALEGIPKAYYSKLHQVRGQVGQITTAANMMNLLEGSALTTEQGEKRVQDAYSLRCVPQVHGASKDAYHYVSHILEREMNAATDNPLIFSEEDQVVSGGNFHGQPIALAVDFLSIAMAEMANISERRIERLVNPQLSGLPAFLTKRGGLHSGYMILQYTAASLVSENKTLAHPASVDSIPSSANQEDHVSMGSIGARKCLSIMGNVLHVLAIEYVCAAQALEFASKLPGKGAQVAYNLLREKLTPLESDREGYLDIEIAKQLIQSGELVNRVQSHTNIKL